MKYPAFKQTGPQVASVNHTPAGVIIPRNPIFGQMYPCSHRFGSFVASSRPPTPAGPTDGDPGRARRR